MMGLCSSVSERIKLKKAALNDSIRVSLDGSDVEHFNLDSCVHEWAKLSTY